ncbi:hypothetical protein A2U01_0059463, partial [Trifolium medium]|nr:hypothetical protein [Trifolium medium]
MPELEYEGGARVFSFREEEEEDVEENDDDEKWRGFLGLSLCLSHHPT